MTPPPTTPPLFVHQRALAGVERFRSFDLAGDHPLYLVGMELPEHRGGPAIAALMVFADGRLIAARAKQVRPKKSLTQIFEFDIEYCDEEMLRRYSRSWNEQLGGFTAVMPWAASDHDVGRALLADVDMAPTLTEHITADLRHRQLGGPSWDDSQAAVAFRTGVVCAVTGITPAVDDLHKATEALELRRELLLTVGHPEAALLASAGRSRNDPVSRLLVEATNVATVSPRAAVVLLRTAAEVLVGEIIGQYDINGSATSLHGRIGDIERAWSPIEEKPSTQDRQEAAWRTRVVACLDLIRQHGNAIHHTHSPTYDDAELSLEFTRRLLSTLGRVEPLDQVPTAPA